MMPRLHQTLSASCVRDYAGTTKPGVVSLFILTAWAAMVLGSPGPPRWSLTLGTLLGLALVIGGAAALNCYLERDRDRQMARTRCRPLPAGRISPRGVLVMSIVLVGAGTILVFAVAGAPAAALAVAGAVYYVVVYTLLLKPRSPYSPMPGGLAGVAPALVGWAAARSAMSPSPVDGPPVLSPDSNTGDAWLDIVYLTVLIFLWSPPHFWSLALSRATEYQRAGIPTLPGARGERETRRQVAAHSLGLVAVSLLPVAAGRQGLLYLAGTALAGILLLNHAHALYRESSNDRARAYFRFSGVYLVVVMAAMIFDRLLRAGPAWAGAPTMLRPESAQARDIVELALILLIICAAILLVVEGVLITSIIRFRKRREDDAPQAHGNTTLEFVWTIIPAGIVVVILSLTINTMNSMELPGGALPVRVIGHQWWWEVGYPQSGVYAANEIHVPEGRAADFALESADVIHSFWIPQLGGKTDLNPGHVNRAGFMAATPGTYLGQCAEFCGLEHARMRFSLVVESPGEFSAWIAHQAEPAATPATTEQQAGREIYEARPCRGCHLIRTVAADPNAEPPAPALAPDLTHVGSRLSLAAGTLDNTRENMVAWLADPQKVKPGNLMPAPDLSDTERDQVAAYLESLK